MHFFEGDIPGAVSVAPASVSDLSGLTAATATLVDPAGAAQDIPATFDGTNVHVTIPALVGVGKHVLKVTLTGPGKSVSLEQARIVVEAEDGGGWYTLDAARRDWQGAPEDDARLSDLLASAQLQVLAYAPELVAGDPIPVNYRAAELLQARNIWNASVTDPNSNSYGGDGYSVPVYPLDWTVKQMLRPKRAVPVVA